MSLLKYIHIPFCAKKCYYCDFTTFEGTHNHRKYFDYLHKEELLYNNFNFKSLYFGGGTPSAVDPSFINEIIERNSQALEEITVELNPEDYLKVNSYKANRLSIGIQTFDDAMLKKIGRLHDSDKAIKAYSYAREFFDNISVDLMFALPDQTLEMLKKDLQILEKLAPDHISIYSLIWQENTVFYQMKKRGKIKALGDEEDAELYEYIINFLEDIGYEHYEISSFAKKGKYGKHNLGYWNNEKYVGLGLGASGYVKDRYTNFKNFSKYYEALDKNEFPISEAEILDEVRTEEYEIILGLRKLKEGIRTDLSENFTKILDYYCEIGFLTKDNKYKLTKKGLFLSNEIFADIIQV